MSSSPRENHDVAIVGLACRFPDANDAHAFWSNIRAQRTSFRPIPADRWHHAAFFSKSQREVDKTWTPNGAFLDEIRSFAALHYGIAPRRLEVMDPQHRLLIEATRVALQDAGYETRPFDKSRTGVFAGLSVSEYKNMLLARVRAMQLASGSFGPAAGSQRLRDAIIELTNRVAPTRAYSLAGVLSNMGAASISQTFDFGGPSFTIDAACAAASVAIYNALLHLRAGLIDVAIAGGAYLNLTPDNLIGFTRVGAISPTGTCRPFDQSADGFVQGEGVGVLLLKRLGDAVEAGDHIYAVIRGVACNNDGRGEGPMTPRVEGQVAVLSKAYADADCSPATVAFFEAHGTATNVGDPVEIESLGRILRDAGVRPEDAPAIGSVKGNIGHAMSAAGVAGLIKGIKALEAGVIPPQPGFVKAHPALGIDRWPLAVAKDEQPLLERGGPRRVGVSAFGFGGTNAHFVLEAPPERKRRRPERPPATPDWPEAILVSAPNHALLRTHLRELSEALTGPRAEHAALDDIAYTLNLRRLEAIRVVIVAHSREQLAARLLEASEKLETVDTQKISPEITLFSAPELRPEVCFLFPGQGAQRLGVLEDLRRRFPVFRERFFALEAELAGLERPLSSYLYPEQRDQAAEHALTQTEICQPAITALSLALASFLRAAGVEPLVSLGHSLGEFSALACARVIDERRAVQLVADRGRAMRDLELHDRGAMIAVLATSDEIAQALPGWEGIWIANKNHPRQVVLSGWTSTVDAAIERLTAAGFETRRLNVSHAFHSPLMDGMRHRMEALTQDLTLAPPEHRVASCIAALPHSSSDETRRVMLEHATSPVDFVRGLEQAKEAGARVFVQIGGGSVLLGLVRATLGSAATTVALAGTEDDGGLEFLRGMATLAALSVPVDFAALYAGEGRDRVDLPATPLIRERYWLVKEEPQLLAQLTHPLPSPLEGFGTVDLPTEFAETRPVKPSLVELFQKQAEVLASHARIVEAQNRLLLGEASDGIELPLLMSAGDTALPTPVLTALPERALSSAPPPRRDSEPKRVVPAPSSGPARIEERVFEIVARVSAFPLNTVRREQRLVDELGFDSIMVADLTRALNDTFPGQTLPQSLFHMKTTVGDLVDKLAEQASPELPVRTEVIAREVGAYRVELEVAPAPDMALADVRGQTWLLTEGGAQLATQVRLNLEQRGARVLRVRFTSELSSAPNTLSFDALNLWPERDAIGLAETIGRAAIAFDGLIHLAGLSASADLLGPRSPVATLLPLAAHLRVERLCVVTGLGGRLGLDGSKTLKKNLAQAGLLGFTKSLARERTGFVRAIDIDPAAAPEQNAEHVVQEILSADRTPEVGLVGHHRYVPVLTPHQWSELPRAGLVDDDVVLITGGTGDVGRRVARHLARHKIRGIVLVGRRPADEKVAALVREIGQLGTPARYLRVDAAQEWALSRAVEEIEQAFGPVTVALHAAGVIEDAPVERKSLESIERVMGVKLNGHHALLGALPKLRTLVLFSSWSARFGNAGQADYAAANEILDRLAVLGAGTTRVVSVAWPPWSSTSMVATIPAPMRSAMEAEGVTFLEDSEGLALLDRLMTGSGMILVGHAVPRRQVEARHDLEISLDTFPYLRDHQLRGRPILPLASATDLMAWIAEATLGAVALADLTLIRPVDASTKLAARLEVKARIGDELSGEVQLSVRENGRYLAAYRARLLRPAALAQVALEKPSEALPLSLESYYRDHTFHGPLLRGIVRIEALTADGVVGVVRGADLGQFLPGSARSRFSADPLVLDSSFQLAGYWAYVFHRRHGYPTGFSRLTQLRPFGQEVRCVVRLEDSTEETFVGSVRYEDERGVCAVIERITGRFTSESLGAPAPEAKLPAKNGAHTNSDGNGTHVSGNGDAAGLSPVEIPEENFRIDRFPELELLDQRLQMAELVGLRNPYFAMHAGTARNTSVVEGVEMINFSSYNYLGFSGHPEVIEAAQQAIAKYGTSVSASRIASGERPIHRELERGIAAHIGVEDAIVYVSGHATNVSTIGTVVGKEDLVLHDALIHESILAGIKLSGATRRPYPHEDMEALERLLVQLRGHFRRVLICAEGIYSMDGDVCDLPRLIELKKRFRALLMIDEAHSAGVLGPSGRGVGHHYPDLDPNDVDLWMGTMSKSYASCGGYIAGSAALVRFLKYSAGGFVYSVGMAPPNAAAALKSLELMQRHPEVVETLRRRSRFFLELAKSRGIDTGRAEGFAVIPAIIGNSFECVQLSAALAARRINVQPIVYPAVEDDAARLRFFLSATHSEDELRHTVDVLAEEIGKLRVGQAQPTLQP